jgi:hypothetical protein
MILATILYSLPNLRDMLLGLINPFKIKHELLHVNLEQMALDVRFC